MISQTIVGWRHRAPHMLEAARNAGVIWLGLFALGIGFGIVLTGHGLPWWLAPAISGLVLAGSLEFILVGMLAVGAPIATIALTTFLINSRHLFYGLSFPLHRVRGRLAKAYSVFALTDEAYALLASKHPDSLSSRLILWTQLGLHASWVTGALVGGLVGATVLDGLAGPDFILTALFVVLTIDAYRAAPDPVIVTLAVVACAAAYLVAPQAMLLVAMTIFSVTLVARHTWNRKDARA